MKIIVKFDKTTFTADTEVSLDASISVEPYSEVDSCRTFHLPDAKAAPFAAGNFIASVDAGASINCPVISSLCAHSSGTHTECVGHALPGAITLNDLDALPSILPSVVLTVVPSEFKTLNGGELYPAGADGDFVITGFMFENAWMKLSSRIPLEVLNEVTQKGALCIRTSTKSSKKDWSGSNPPYLCESSMKWALDHGFEHILVDLPSVDKENDEGFLIAHRTFWQLPPKGIEIPSGTKLSNNTITELCDFPEELVDGLYLLNLQVAPIDLDAAPSRPLFFPLKE